MERLDIDILGFSDVQWPSLGDIPISNGYLYYSGGNDPNHRYGVISHNIKTSLLHVTQYSEQIILLQLQAHSYKINLIHICAPTADKSEDELEGFYSHLEEVLKITTNRDVNIILGILMLKWGKALLRIL